MRARFIWALPVVLVPATVDAAPWEDATDETIGTTGEWSNKVELADLDGDGDVDIIFANGGNYSSPGSPEPNGVFLNDGSGGFSEATESVFGSGGDLARVIKARDVDADGDVDLFIGTTYDTQSRLFLGDGNGGFTEATATNLPMSPGSFGDAEFGDVDGDGDLDLVLADWGGTPFDNSAPVRLWLNDGAGVFTDASSQMPAAAVAFSWDLELADVDNDYDLDVLVSSKSSPGSFLFHNDGSGTFTDASSQLPAFTNNYEFELIDFTGDGFLDAVTINDGAALTEHIFVGDGNGGFVDESAERWPAQAQSNGSDDNVIAILDVESDGDPDFLIGSLNAEDRLLVNDGGVFTLNEGVVTGSQTPGTLGIAFADLNGDDKLDLVQSQGEVADSDKVYFGVDVPVDTAGPVVTLVETYEGVQSLPITLRARIHDNKTPVMTHDFESVRVEVMSNAGLDWVDMVPMGGTLWRATLDEPSVGGNGIDYRVCATDRAGNETCGEYLQIQLDGDGGTGNTGDDTADGGDTADTGDDTSSDGGDTGDTGGDDAGEAGTGAEGETGAMGDDGGDDGGCSCRTGSSPAAGVMALLLLLGLRRRE